MTYHYVKFYVSIIIHLEVININVRNFNFPIGFYNNPHPFWTPQNMTLTPFTTKHEILSSSSWDLPWTSSWSAERKEKKKKNKKKKNKNNNNKNNNKKRSKNNKSPKLNNSLLSQMELNCVYGYQPNLSIDTLMYQYQYSGLYNVDIFGYQFNGNIQYDISKTKL